MPISVTCPTCNGKLKAPDSVAGRKVKCPKCGTILAVEPVASPPPAPQSAEVVADDEQTAAAGDEQGTPEKRRKKKRKKKRAAQKSNAWIWMVGIGGTVAMIGVIGLILFATLGWERVVIEAISLAIMIPISTVFLVISMLVANSVLGGLDFGEPKIAIPKAAILLLLVNLSGRIPLPAGYFLPSLVWLFGLMLFFDLDIFEALLLGFINWVLNFAVRYFLLIVILSAIAKGYMVVPPTEPDPLMQQEEDEENVTPYDSDILLHRGAHGGMVELSLKHCGFTDEDMRHMRKMIYFKTMKDLDLSDNPEITDKGIKYLSEWQQLEALNLKGTKVSSKGVKWLKEKIPNVKITI